MSIAHPKHEFEITLSEFMRNSSATMDGRPLKGLQGLSLSYDDVGRATLILKLRPERVRIVSSDPVATYTTTGDVATYTIPRVHLDAVGGEGAKVTLEHRR